MKVIISILFISFYLSSNSSLFAQSNLKVKARIGVNASKINADYPNVLEFRRFGRIFSSKYDYYGWDIGMEIVKPVSENLSFLYDFSFMRKGGNIDGPIYSSRSKTNVLVNRLSFISNKVGFNFRFKQCLSISTKLAFNDLIRSEAYLTFWGSNGQWYKDGNPTRKISKSLEVELLYRLSYFELYLGYQHSIDTVVHYEKFRAFKFGVAVSIINN